MYVCLYADGHIIISVSAAMYILLGQHAVCVSGRHMHSFGYHTVEYTPIPTHTSHLLTIEVHVVVQLIHLP